MSARILVVEDNPMNMKVVLMTLKRHGYTLLEAVDGKEALEVAISERPDLILMDIQLPKMDGLEVTRRLRQMPEFEQTPIIALSAYAMKGDRERGMEAGFDDYLSKPVNTRELPKVIEDMLSKRRGTDSGTEEEHHG